MNLSSACPGARSIQRSRLLWRIGRRYQTQSQVLRLGALEFTFTRIADPNRVLDEVAEAADRRERRTGERQDGEALHLPYWAELWDSATGVAQWLARNEWESIYPGEGTPRALDLGCGMGLCGTVAAAMGARVMFADLEPPALLFARLNSLPWSRRVRTRRLNWQTARLNETFDVIIGADILYERSQWTFLSDFWSMHLAPQGRVILGEPGRQTGDGFIEWIVSQGWTLHFHEEPVTTRPRAIRILELRRC